MPVSTPTDGGPRPQLKKAPRWPFWAYSLRPWLKRRAQRSSDQLTDRLGGPPRRRVIVLLGLVLGLSAADGSSVGAIAAQLQPALGIGTAELGLLVTVSALVGALAAIPFGVLVDKTRRVNVLAASIVLWGVAEAASGFAASFEMLLLTRLLLGAVTATAVPAVASLTGDFFPAGERGRIYGYISVGEVVGAGVGIGVSSLVSAAFGWRAAFVLLAVPSIALAWALWKKLPEPARGGQSHLLPGATRFVPVEEVDGRDARRAAPDAARERTRRRRAPTTGCSSRSDGAGWRPTRTTSWSPTRRRCRCGRSSATCCACAPTCTSSSRPHSATCSSPGCGRSRSSSPAATSTSGRRSRRSCSGSSARGR